MNLKTLVENVSKLKRIYTPQNRLYSIADLTAEFGFKKWFWRELIRVDKLPVIKVRRKYYVDSDSLESLIDKWSYTLRN
jgi:hypothetical protein